LQQQWLDGRRFEEEVDTLDELDEPAAPLPRRRRLPSLQAPPATQLQVFGCGHTLRGNPELQVYAAVFLRWWYKLIPEADVVETVEQFTDIINAAYKPVSLAREHLMYAADTIVAARHCVQDGEGLLERLSRR